MRRSRARTAPAAAASVSATRQNAAPRTATSRARESRAGAGGGAAIGTGAALGAGGGAPVSALTARQVMQRIEATAHHPPAGWDPLVGHGTVDPLAAVSAGKRARISAASPLTTGAA
ncbi:hypothetical protein PICSAR246_00011 [Mycobacterium avium subsp. paratuberculosis]|nr:hypothetical protein PICSAR246_00011 [Mycobacterium avium subsp. paratuberculosis]